MPGLWAAASSILAPVVSSHLSLRSCGLIVKHPAAAALEGDVDHSHSIGAIRNINRKGTNTFSDHTLVEYTMRGISLSAADHGKDETVADSVEMRPVAELGSAIEGLAFQIFNGSATYQRVFKLTRPRSSSQATYLNQENTVEERQWLFPIRTPHDVTAILRVCFDLPKEPFSPSTPLSIIHNPPTRFGGMKDNGNSFYDSVVSEENEFNVSTHLPVRGGQVIDVQSVLDTAQTNILNFADVLAPLLVAADASTQSRRAKEGLEESLTRQNKKVAIGKEELALTMQKLSILTHCVDNIAKVFSFHGSFSSTELFDLTEKEKTQIRQLATELSSALSDVLVVRIEIVVGVEEEPLEEANRDLLLPLTDVTGSHIGHIRCCVNENGDGAHLARDVMTSLRDVLSGIVVSVAGQFRLRSQLERAFEARQTSEDALVIEQAAVAELQQKEVDLSGLVEFYRTLADTINQCLLFNTRPHRALSVDGPLAAEESALRNGSFLASPISQKPLLQEFLRRLCTRLPSVMAGSCFVSFAVLDGKGPLYLAEESKHKRPHSAVVHSIAWIYGGKGEREVGEARGMGMGMGDLPESARDMAANLAQVALNKRQQSSIEISLPSPSGNGDALTYRILTIPLRYVLSDGDGRKESRHRRPPPPPHAPLGVMQVFFDLTCSRDPDIDGLCGDMASAISCVLSKEVHEQQLAALLELKDHQLLSMGTKVDELNNSIATHIGEVRLWQAVASFNSVFIQTVSSLLFSGKDGLDRRASVRGEQGTTAVAQALLVDEVVSCLLDCGLTITISSGSAIANLPQEEPANPNPNPAVRHHHIHTSIPLNETGTLFANIIRAERLLAENREEGERGEECAECIASLIRRVAVLEQLVHVRHVENARKDSSWTKKLEKLKSSLQESAMEVTTVRTLASNQTRQVEMLKETVARKDQVLAVALEALPLFCIPAMRDFQSLIDSISSFSSTSDKNDQLWASILEGNFHCTLT